jgi:hypothetical protein
VSLTLSVDEQVVKRARRVARVLGKSLNQLVREYLESIAGQADAEQDIDEIHRLSAQGKGRSRGWRFNRDQIHART